MSMSVKSMKSSAMLVVFFGISSGLSYAATRLLLSRSKSRKESESPITSSYTPQRLRPLLLSLRQKILTLLHKNKRRIVNDFDLSTLLTLCTLTLTQTQIQFRGKNANALLLPCLYLLLRDAGENTHTDRDREHDGNRDEHLNEQCRDDDQDHGQSQPQTLAQTRTGTGDEVENLIEIPVPIRGETENNKDENWEHLGPETTEPSPQQRQHRLQQQQQQQNEKRNRSDSVLTQTSEIGSVISSTTATQAQNTRYLEMLVHNVSHTDLVLCLGIPEEMQVSTQQYNSKREESSRTPRVSNKKEEPHVLCRPRFSAFDMFCARILKVMQSSCDNTDTMKRLYSSIMSFPSYERSESSPRFSLVAPKPSKQSMLPVGFNLSQIVECGDQDDLREKHIMECKTALSLTHDDLSSLRIRGKDMVKMEKLTQSGYLHSPRHYYSSDNVEVECKSSCNTSESESSLRRNLSADKMPYLESVFFPLLSSLLRRWHKQIASKYGSNQSKSSNLPVKKVLILVTGVGTPRNWTHSISGNSTEACAKIMEIFIHVLYPDVTVVKLHSKREIFRYDENITFANKELLPCIDAYRDAHARGEKYPDEIGENDIGETSTKAGRSIAKPFDTDWKQSFSVTLSFADGAPARTHAIQSSLRPYRPNYFHFWQLKTFWHDSKICDDDIEVHSFESMETVPAMEVQHTNTDIQRIVEEMKKFRQSFMQTLKDGGNDLATFWLRKTKKPVLAVLGVKNQYGKEMALYRGTNMEVSMPTGSLCAERNVIGTALAANPGLRREDLLMVAVLAIPLSREDFSSHPTPPQLPSPPPGSNIFCTTIEPKQRDIQGGVLDTTFISEVEQKLSQYQRPENFRRSMSIGSFASIVEGNGSDESDSSWDKMGSTNTAGIMGTDQPVQTKEGILNLPQEILSGAKEKGSSPSSGTDTPIRKIQLHGGEIESTELSQKKMTSRFIRRKKKTVLVHSAGDINPLRPCGSCNEWLKKIAESNPYFKVVTFTDSECNGVYVTPCQE